MASAESSLPKTASLDELVALTDEMAALARAGVPLERGLAETSRDLGNREGRLARLIATRMERGETLEHVLATSPELFPPAYRKVVEAGLRAGRLPAALEGLASASRRAAELRRLARASLIYPLVIAFLTYYVFCFSLKKYHPQLQLTHRAMRFADSRLNVALVKLGETAHIWSPWVPVVVLVAVSLWWFRSSRSTWSGWTLSGLTPVGRVLANGRISTFADTLALLVEQRVPLDQSLVLAAEASGDPRLTHAARQLSDDLVRGQPLDAARATAAGFPPLLGWLLAGGNQAALAQTLRQTAESYRRRALRLDEWMRFYLPLGLTLAIGGTVVVLYALSVFLPWYHLLREAAK